MSLLKKLEKWEKRQNIKDLQKEKQESLYRMLDMRFPTNKIISGLNILGETNYFLLEHQPLIVSEFVKLGHKNFSIKIKQLTGDDAGKIYEIIYPYSNIDPWCDFHLEPYITFGINGFVSDPIGQDYSSNKFEKIYGKTIVFGALLVHWKADNGQFMDVNVKNDYAMVKAVYDSEDILDENEIKNTIKGNL